MANWQDFLKPTKGKILIVIWISIFGFLLLDRGISGSFSTIPRPPPPPEQVFLQEYVQEPLSVILLLPGFALWGGPAIIPVFLGYYYLLAIFLYPILLRVSRIATRSFTLKELATRIRSIQSTVNRKYSWENGVRMLGSKS